MSYAFNRLDDKVYDTNVSEQKLKSYAVAFDTEVRENAKSLGFKSGFKALMMTPSNKIHPVINVSDVEVNEMARNMSKKELTKVIADVIHNNGVFTKLQKEVLNSNVSEIKDKYLQLAKMTDRIIKLQVFLLAKQKDYNTFENREKYISQSAHEQDVSDHKTAKKMQIIGLVVAIVLFLFVVIGMILIFKNVVQKPPSQTRNELYKV